MNKTIKILLLISSFFIMAGSLLSPIYAIFVQDIGGDVLTAGTTYSVYAIISGILIYFIGKWEDRVKNQEKLIVLGYFIALISYVGYIFIRRPIELFFVQSLLGISEAIRTPLYDGLYSKNLDRGKFASEWGIWESMNWIITGISAIIGSVIATYFGFMFVLILMAAFALFGFISSLFLLKK